MALHSKNINHGVKNALFNWAFVNAGTYVWRFRPVRASDYGTQTSGITAFVLNTMQWWTNNNSDLGLVYNTATHGAPIISASTNVGNVNGVEITVQKTVNTHGAAPFSEGVFARGYFNTSVNLQSGYALQVTSLTVTFSQGDTP